MVSVSDQVRRHFLPWDRPLAVQAAEWLAGPWRGEGALDLSRSLVVVQTQQSGRRLREALAAHAAACGGAVFPPQVLTPDQTVGGGSSGASASRPEMLLAWAQVLREMDPRNFRDVFPIDPPAPTLSWALSLAETLLGVQATLGEIGWRLSDVAAASAALQGGLPEEPRWRQLAELEGRYDSALRRRGLTDAQAARSAAARNPTLPPGVERVVVVATPDPLPIALPVLSAFAKSVPVEVLVFADSAEADGFDGWGRPVASEWVRRPFELGGPSSLARPQGAAAHLCVDATAQAERIAEFARGYGNPDGMLAIGVADPDAVPALESVLGRARIPVFNPSGRQCRDEGLYPLIAALCAVVSDASFSAVESLARCPDLIAFLSARLGNGFSAGAWLGGLDDLRARHLPPDLAAARVHAQANGPHSVVARGLEELDALRRDLGGKSFAEGATEVLKRIFADRTLDPKCEMDVRFEASARAWADVVRECLPVATELAPQESWELALRLYASSSLADEKPPGALDLQGWLEVLWEDAPHLAIVGLNDGRIPEAIVGDAFLPETLRERIGLRSNEARFARDAYILAAVASARRACGRLDILFGKASEAGDPLKPSRLLLQCRDSELPDRIALLFAEPELSGRHVPWSRSWLLKPPGHDQALTRVRVTGLRRWLECPFRFYLHTALKMEAVDPEKTEMNETDFGTLCHAALEAMAADPGIRDCADESTLRDFLADALESRARDRFGSRLVLPLVVQMESARQRLGKAAEIEAGQRAQGWRTVQVEWPFEVVIEGVTVAGVIDRIDRNLETGRTRVLDYKTSDKAVSPEEAHLKRPSRGGPVPREFATLSEGKRTRAWTDLQLPLYLEAIAQKYPGASCGYFNLPKSVGETGIQLWEAYTPEMRSSAMRCAEGVCRAICIGDFWPPNETIDPDWDEFSGLFRQGAQASIEWGTVR